MARKPTQSSKPADSEPVDNPFDALLGGNQREGAPLAGEDAPGMSPQASTGASEPAPATPLPETLPARPEPPEPLVGAIREPPPRFAVPAAFSDDPPEGWGSGEGNAGAPDPVSMSLGNPHAARATGGEAPEPVPPPVPVPVERQDSRVPEIRTALARAAAQPNATRYRSRIAVSAAYRYDGRLAEAPSFIDRNWLSYDRGPAIDIPDVGMVRKGQWIVIQSVLSDDGSPSFSELKIYDDAVFTSLFRPVPGGGDAEQEPEAGPLDGHGGARPGSGAAGRGAG